MRRVYIAHRFGGDPEQRRLAANWYAHACGAYRAGKKVMPVAPWIVLTLAWDESRREEGLQIDLEQIAECDELWACGPTISPGMEVEIAHARKLGKPVLRFDAATPEEFCAKYLVPHD